MKYKHVIANIQGMYPLKFERTAKKKFKITYGKQEREFSSSDEAAAEFSNCLLHLAQCEGKLDGERELF